MVATCAVPATPHCHGRARPASDAPCRSRNPAGAGSLRNAGPLEFPTSPVITRKARLCTTSSDLNRRDNAPNTAGEAAPQTTVVGKVSCLDQRLDEKGLELPVDD